MSPVRICWSSEQDCLFAVYREAFEGAIKRLEGLGGQQVPVDFKPLCKVAEMLYNSAFVAERYAGIQTFLEAPQVLSLCKVEYAWSQV